MSSMIPPQFNPEQAEAVLKTLLAKWLKKNVHHHSDYGINIRVSVNIEIERFRNHEDKDLICIESLDLSVPIHMTLTAANIYNIGQLRKKTPKELLCLPGFGKKKFLEIKRKLEGIGVDVKHWGPVTE